LVYRPRIIDTQQGTCQLKFEGGRWSAYSSTYLNAWQVELRLRRYPSNQASRSVQVVINWAERLAQAGALSEFELSGLEGVLDALLNNAGT